MAPKVRVATDCSGMETPLMALRNLGVDFRHVMSCDIDKNVKKTIMANFPPEKGGWYDDLMARDNSTAPESDLYVAGFPCQPFSSAGLQKAFEDARGTVLAGCCRYLEAKRPAAAILENVGNIQKMQSGQIFKEVMGMLKSVGRGCYNIYCSPMNTQDHGVPQSRPRVYWVLIRKDLDLGGFAFPEVLETPSIEEFLEPRTRKATLRDLPPPSQGTARRNVQTIMKKLIAEGKDPLNKPFVIDVDSSSDRAKCMEDRTPCMTKSRAAGHWVTNRGRRMTKHEQLALQGMSSIIPTFVQVVSDNQLGQQIGNAMSCNVLERILVRLLPAAGLTKDTLVDNWEEAAKKRAGKNGAEPSTPKRKRASSSPIATPEKTKRRAVDLEGSPSKKRVKA